VNKSAIEWTEATWSPVIGCTKVSQGCKNCYAEREVETRWSKNPKSIWYGRSFADVLCRPETLAGAKSPLTWKKPRRIFVCPRADLFHDDVPDLFIADVFGVMAATPQHTYQVLTKRPERARWLLGGEGILNFNVAVEECAAMYSDADVVWPLPNVQLGTSIEDQPTADARISELLATPAAVRWVSAEPLLAAIDLGRHLWKCCGNLIPGHPGDGWMQPPDPPECCLDRVRTDLHWIVAGGESGANARPMHPAWARTLRDQCAAADVPFLFKQWGEWLSAELDECPCGPPDKQWMWADGATWTKFDGQRGIPLFRRVGKHRAGRLLDGVLHDAYPDVPG
jgi:protein gp37